MSVNTVHSLKKMLNLNYRSSESRCPQIEPATAKHSLGYLFEGDAYVTIRQVSSELVFHIYLVSEIISSCSRHLTLTRKDIDILGEYIDFALFTVACRCLQQVGAH